MPNTELEEYTFTGDQGDIQRKKRTIGDLNARRLSRKQDITELEQSIERYEADLEFYKKHPVESLLSALHNHCGGEELPEFICQHIKDPYDHKKHSVEVRQRRIVEKETEIHDLQRRIARLKVELSGLEANSENKTVRTADVNEAIKKTPASKFKIVQRSDGKVYLSFIITDVKANIHFDDYGSYPLINAGDDIYINIPRTEVRIFLNNAEMYCHKTRKTKNNPITGYNFYNSAHTDVHPHILSNNKACLGDFQHPLKSCIDNGDVMGIITIASMFLSQVNTDDPAGRTWKEYIRYNDNSLRTLTRSLSGVNSETVQLRCGNDVYEMVAFEGIRVSDKGVTKEIMYKPSRDVLNHIRVMAATGHLQAEAITNRWGTHVCSKMLAQSEIDDLPGMEVITPLTPEEIEQQRLDAMRDTIMQRWQQSPDEVENEAWELHTAYLDAKLRWALFNEEQEPVLPEEEQTNEIDEEFPEDFREDTEVNSDNRFQVTEEYTF